MATQPPPPPPPPVGLLPPPPPPPPPPAANLMPKGVDWGALKSKSKARGDQPACGAGAKAFDLSELKDKA